MGKPSSFSVILFFALASFIGVGLAPFLDLRLNPSKSVPALKVNFRWPGASAKAVELEVTSKFEGVFSGIAGISSVSSVSKKEQGTITLKFKKGVNLDAVRFEVSNKVRQIFPDLTEGVTYPDLSLNVAGETESPILTYRLNASEAPHYIKKFAENNLVNELNEVKGINQVRIYGAVPFEWRITYDAKKLNNLGLSVDQLSNAIKNYFQKWDLGTLVDSSRPENEFSVLLKSNNSYVSDWGSIPISNINGRVLFLRDLASVRFKEGKPNSYYRINGLNTINLVIYAEGDANTLVVAKETNNKIAELTKKLPEGWSIQKTKDSSEYLGAELQKISYRSLFSIGLLLLFAVLVYRSLKYLTIISSCLIMNLLISLALFYLLKVEIHLYSLAGITVSFGIIIDNCLVMIDHYRNKKDLKVFRAILSATLTTIGALAIIPLLGENQKANLIDFASVIVISLSVSLAIALFLIPALQEKLRLQKKSWKYLRKRRKRTLKFNAILFYVIVKLSRVKWILIITVVIGFGIPVHLLPDEIEGQDSVWSSAYNRFLGSDLFRNEVKTELSKYLGGTLRLFTENVFENSRYSDPERLRLVVRGTMPEGCTIEQLNTSMKKMENFITEFSEVEVFETSITSYRDGRILIYFKKHFENGPFPYILKSQLENKAISLGGMDWSVNGVGRGFSNALGTDYKGQRIILKGYSYDQLNRYAQILKEKVLENPRVKEVDIAGNNGWKTAPQYEFNLSMDREKLAYAGLGQRDIYDAVKKNIYADKITTIANQFELQDVVLESDRFKEFNIWDLKNTPLNIDRTQYKLGQFGHIQKLKTGHNIHKSNQEYQLVVAYDFLGPSMLAERYLDQCKLYIDALLPVGFHSQKPKRGWDKEDKSQYYYIFIVITIIFFICSIVLGSIKQSFVILWMIPISFIGIFLTFYLFDINFDQGGYGSFLLICGITVNSALFIINDYNNLKNQFPKKSEKKLIFKAFNQKIIPVLLTVLSTVAGLIPFVFWGQEEVFWYAFASGSIGGILFSVFCIFFFLPAFLIKSGRHK